jgi:lysophospholipase L1-like esterase
MGDSITRGKVWKEHERRPYITDKSYPYILKDMLDIDVCNDGVCDLTSEQMLQYVRKGAGFDGGSAVIFEIGGNDCNLDWRAIKKNPLGEHDALIPLSHFRENLLSIIDIIMGHGAVPVLSTLPPLDPDKYYNLLKRVFGEWIKVWIDNNGGIYKWQERYSDLIKAASRAKGIHLVDIRQSFLESEDYRKYISFDGIHPNEEGYSLIARTCGKALKAILG